MLSERAAKRIVANTARATKLMIVNSLGEENGSALRDCQVTNPTKPSQVRFPTTIRGIRKAIGSSKDMPSRIAATSVSYTHLTLPTNREV